MKNEYDIDVETGAEEVRSEGGRRGRSPMILARILSVAVAVFIWIYVVNISSDNYEKTFTLIPIRIEGEQALAASSQMSVYDQSETVVSVTVSGKRSDINALDSSDFKAWIDVSNLDEGGRHSLPVKLSLPDRVSAISHSPSEVSILADAKVSKTVPVQVKLLSYSINDNLSISGTTPSLDKISVTGPAATLERIAAVEAEVDLSSGWITSSFLHNARLQPVDDTGAQVNSEYISLSHDSVDVSVRVVMTARIPVDVSFLSSVDPSEYEVSLSASYVEVSGDVFAVSELKVVTIATIGASTPAEFTVSASSLVLPLGVTAVPGTADITVKVKQIPKPETTTEETTAETPVETTAPDVTTSAETWYAIETSTAPAETAAP